MQGVGRTVSPVRQLFLRISLDMVKPGCDFTSVIIGLKLATSQTVPSASS